MPRLHRDIAARQIEYLCDRCERGLYRLVSKTPITSNYVHKWQHRCSHCGDLAEFTLPYPLIQVEGRMVSHLFIQRDALPPPAGPVASGFNITLERQPESS